MNNYLKKVAGNSVWMIVSKIINIIIGLTVSVCVTRYLGTEQRGEMANAQAISSFWGFIASLGLLDIIISRFSLEKNKSATVAATAMTMMFGSGIIAFSLSIVSAIILRVEINVLVYTVIYALVHIFQSLTVYEYWFYSNSNSKYYAITQSIVHVLFLLISFVGVPLKANLVYFVVVAALETIVTYLSLIYCYKISKCEFIGKFIFDKKIASELLKLSLPMIAMGFATTIYMKIDQIMVGSMIGNSELGLYSVAVSLAEYWYFIPATIYSSYLPIITEVYENIDEFKKRLQQFADIMTLIGYVAAFGVMIFGHWGVTFLYGTEFEGAAYNLMIYIWSGVFTCISYSGQAFYITHKDTKTVMWINIIGAILNFVLNAILIKRYGSIGAAVATLLQYIIVCFGQMLVLRKKYGELYKIQIKALFPFVRLWRMYKLIIQKKEV